MMFGLFTHPKPIGSRRPVAEMSVPGANRDTIEAGHVLIVGARTNSRVTLSEAESSTGPSHTTVPSCPKPMPLSSLEIRVGYRLIEYLRIISNFEPRSATHRAGMAKARSRSWATSFSTRWFERAAIVVIGTPVYFHKRLTIGACVFRIDAERIARKSKAGCAVKPWSSVVHVHQLEHAYLIELEKGAMPIPYRCFSPAQRIAFEALVPAGRLDTAKQGVRPVS